MVTLNFHFENLCRTWCRFVRLHTKAPFYCCVLVADLLQHSCICICTTRHHVLDLNEFHALVKRKISSFRNMGSQIGIHQKLQLTRLTGKAYHRVLKMVLARTFSLTPLPEPKDSFSSLGYFNGQH